MNIPAKVPVKINKEREIGLEGSCGVVGVVSGGGIGNRVVSVVEIPQVCVYF